MRAWPGLLTAAGNVEAKSERARHACIATGKGRRGTSRGVQERGERGQLYDSPVSCTRMEKGRGTVVLVCNRVKLASMNLQVACAQPMPHDDHHKLQPRLQPPSWGSGRYHEPTVVWEESSGAPTLSSSSWTGVWTGRRLPTATALTQTRHTTSRRKPTCSRARYGQSKSSLERSLNSRRPYNGHITLKQQGVLTHTPLRGPLLKKRTPAHGGRAVR